VIYIGKQLGSGGNEVDVLVKETFAEPPPLALINNSLSNHQIYYLILSENWGREKKKKTIPVFCIKELCG